MVDLSSIQRDIFFMDLTPEEKLVYMYLFPYPHFNARKTGICKEQLKTIAFETLLTQEEVSSIISNFQKIGIIHYEIASTVTSSKEVDRNIDKSNDVVNITPMGN